MNATNPYAPPTATVSDAADAGIIEKADRLVRLGAALIDGLIGVLLVVPFFISVGLNFQAITDVSMLMGVGGLITLVLLLAWIAVTIYLVNRNGQTIGKKLVGIKVVRSDGSQASLGRIFWLRNFVNALPGAIPFVGSLYNLADPLFIFGEKRQCIHDLIADTIVVRA
ncbi:MAG TPA: RDD family protein [Povalibacter sp.]|nr:RDD family protein [Povalibacter sp.]